MPVQKFSKLIEFTTYMYLTSQPKELEHFRKASAILSFLSLHHNFEYKFTRTNFIVYFYDKTANFKNIVTFLLKMSEIKCKKICSYRNV